ncbi:MAG: zeta toxin family protein [Christensenellaceae bacterium]|nr:zeta toxin family protein [Christensenellaceae bacterium]
MGKLKSIELNSNGAKESPFKLSVSPEVRAQAESIMFHMQVDCMIKHSDWFKPSAGGFSVELDNIPKEEFNERLKWLHKYYSAFLKVGETRADVVNQIYKNITNGVSPSENPIFVVKIGGIASGKSWLDDNIIPDKYDGIDFASLEKDLMKFANPFHDEIHRIYSKHATQVEDFMLNLRGEVYNECFKNNYNLLIEISCGSAKFLSDCENALKHNYKIKGECVVAPIEVMYANNMKRYISGRKKDAEANFETKNARWESKANIERSFDNIESLVPRLTDYADALTVYGVDKSQPITIDKGDIGHLKHTLSNKLHETAFSTETFADLESRLKLANDNKDLVAPEIKPEFDEMLKNLNAYLEKVSVIENESAMAM